MKLRLRSNSVRFRLGKSEVDCLRSGGECRETVSFPGGQLLEYALRPWTGTEIGASFNGSLLCVEVPASNLTNWCNTELVGLSAKIAVPGAAPLEVLIEKDFRCLDVGVLEDQSDTFDNPLEMHLACQRD